MASRNPLLGLVASLRGAPPSDCAWEAVVALANRSLTTPALAARTEGSDRRDGLPRDLREFLAEVLRRNMARNERLLAQLAEAAGALNAKGIRPLLLKGTALLASHPDYASKERLLSDLDLMVAPADFVPSVDCLLRSGYRTEADCSDGRVPAVLLRPDQPGSIDLHTGMQGLAMQCDFAVASSHATVAHIGSAEVLVPSPTVQMMILVLHDQLKGRDYLQGTIDLRHLIDMEVLSRSPTAIDWSLLASLFPRGYARTALEVQLLTAKRLMGLSVPPQLCRSMLAKAQYWRRLLQARWPMSRVPLTIATLVADPRYLVARQASLKQMVQASAATGGRRPRPSSKAGLMHLVQVKGSGKI